MTMLAWYGVGVVLLSRIVLGMYSSNDCYYGNDIIYCNDNLEIIPTLSCTLTDYKEVCIYLGL